VKCIELNVSLQWGVLGAQHPTHPRKTERKHCFLSVFPREGRPPLLETHIN
jgi:hypothetical protein